MYECHRGDRTQNDLVIDGTTQTLEGDLKFSNNVTIRNQGQLRVGPTGVLRIRARSITVESNTTINANDLGVHTRGAGSSATSASCYSSCNGQTTTTTVSAGSSYGTVGQAGIGSAYS